MIYTYAYPRPAVTVDIIVTRTFKNSSQILLIERKNEPFKNYLSDKDKGSTKDEQRKKDLDNWTKEP